MSKIVFLDDSSSFGGAQVAALNLANYIGALNNFEVHFIFSKNNVQLSEKIKSSKEIISHPYGYQKLPVFIFSQVLIIWICPWIIFKILKLKPHVAIINMPGLEFGLLYGLLLRFLNVRVIPWVHNPCTYNDLQIKNGVIKRLINCIRDKSIDLYISLVCKEIYTVSESSATDLSKRLKGKKIKILRNILPLDESKYNKLKNECEKYINKFSGRIIVPGRVSFADKGQDRLYKYFQELQNAEVKIHFYGDGSDLESLKKACSYYRNISLFGHRDNWISYLNNGDIVVLPSRYDTQSLVALEAMVFGCRIIASDIPIFKSLLLDDNLWNFDAETGFIQKLNQVCGQDLIVLRSYYKTKLQDFSGDNYKFHLLEVLNAKEVN